VQEANALGGSTNITLVTAGTYTLSIRGADEDNSAAGDIDFRSSINLYAPPGSGNATVTGAAGFGDRLFDIPAGTLSTNVTFEPRLILKGGTAPTGEDGGAIRSVGTGYLFLNQMTISNSSARSGGGVYATGGVGTKLDSNIPVLSGNTATSNGGGIDVEGQGTANFLRVSATGNSAATGGGIAAYIAAGSTGSATSDGQNYVQNNTATVAGGGMAVSHFSAWQFTVSGNTAPSGGGVDLVSTNGPSIFAGRVYIQ